MGTEEIIYGFVLLTAILYGGFNLSKLKPPYKILWVLLIVTFIDEIVNKYLAYKIHSNAPAYHVFAPIQYTFFSAIYFMQYPPKSFSRYFSIFSVFFIVVFSVINAVFFEKIDVTPTNVLLIISLFLLVHIISTYHNILNEINYIPLHKQALFWYNTANLFYCSSTFFFWAFFNYLAKDDSIPELLFRINHVITITTYFLYTLALVFRPQKQSNPSLNPVIKS